MKRGLISWDKLELPESTLTGRLDLVRARLAEQELAALIVYSDSWRSNQGRYFANVMPYWNRSLLAIPREGAPVLFCGLSPRVYPWIRSVTILEDIRPGAAMAEGVLKMCREQRWSKIGVLELAELPEDLHGVIAAGGVDVSDVAWSKVHTAGEEAELSMYRRAVTVAREGLEEMIPKGQGMLDHDFVGQLERTFRRAGAEDLVVLLGNGRTSPRPATGSNLGDEFSVSLALEYRGHWVRLSRAMGPANVLDELRGCFEQRLRAFPEAPSRTSVCVELLSSAYPFEFCGRTDLGDGTLFGLHVDLRRDDRWLSYGDTCIVRKNGPELLQV
jgi:hypothetical protein